jgi:hypothetical protein
MSFSFAGGVATVSSGFQVEYTTQTSPLQALLLARAAKSTGYGFGNGNGEFNLATDVNVDAVVTTGTTIDLNDGPPVVTGGNEDYGRVLYLRLELPATATANVAVVSADLDIETTLTPGAIVTREYPAPGRDVSAGGEITLTSATGTQPVRVSVIGRVVVTP